LINLYISVGKTGIILNNEFIRERIKNIHNEKVITKQLLVEYYQDFLTYKIKGMKLKCSYNTGLIWLHWFKTANHIHVPLWPGRGFGFGWWIFNGSTFEELGIHDK